MREAITDTGPVLHLHEIDWLEALRVFDRLVIPDLVVEELRTYGLDPNQLGITGVSTTIVVVEKREWGSVINRANQPTIQPADAQVFVLAQAGQFQEPILTDDLALRRQLENHQATVVGSVGILIRAYTTGYLTRHELENAIDALFTTSTLHLSRAFRSYIHHLIANLS